jgi:hypothetical protein
MNIRDEMGSEQRGGLPLLDPEEDARLPHLHE